MRQRVSIPLILTRRMSRVYQRDRHLIPHIHTDEVYDLSEHISTSTGPKFSNDDRELDPTTKADDLSGPPTSHGRSGTQSPASESYETLPEVPITHFPGSIHSDIDTTTKPSRPTIIVSAKKATHQIDKGPKNHHQTREIGLPTAPSGSWALCPTNRMSQRQR